MKVGSTVSNQDIVGSSNDVSDNSNNVTNNNPGSSTDNLFLKLLVSEIQNQDPTNPMDSSQFVNQLSQMAQVQAMEGMSALMVDNITLMDNVQTLATGNLVNQHVMVQTNSLDSDGSTVVQGRLTLDASSDNVNVTLKDEAGKEYIIPLGQQDQGPVDFSVDPQALDMPPGKYTVSVTTGSDDGKTTPVELGGTVKNVRIPLDGSPTVLNISGIGEVKFTDISQIGDNDNSSSINA
ncbi:flagellar hook capping FlgD N-terminal domain-containing protein [Enterobacter ludwigii]|uniref:flagellar hook capping FlgD N-terminal domain-containing protein n=1 Tax=Enterobacter ludwigii TaxID=299767 RepID=UPI003F6E51F6